MKLALQLPWGAGSLPTEVGYNPATNFPVGTTTIGSAMTAFGEVAIYVGGFLMFFWATWGVFDYLRAEGNKEALAKARKRIQWAIVGFIILLLSFFMSNAIKTILNPGEPTITQIIIK